MAISSERGMENWLSCIYADDGLREHGGETVALIGSLGSGKTTLLLQVAEFSRYCDGPKAHLVQQILHGQPPTIPTHPAGVIWRGRKLDYWPNLLPESWRKSYPYYKFDPKPVYLHTFHEDNLVFSAVEDPGNDAQLPVLPTARPYTSVADLYNHLREDVHSVHVVYEPQSRYVMEPSFTRRLYAQKMTVLQDPSILDKPMAAPTGAWWIEFSEHLLRAKGREFWTLIHDEGHQIAGFNSSGNLWHSLDWFANSLIDMRKSNITYCISTHNTSLVDWRVLDRIIYYVWLPGSTPAKRFSMVRPYVIYQYSIGEGVIEQRAKQFGHFQFDRITKQEPLVKAELVA